MTRLSDEPTLARRITAGAMWGLAGRVTTAICALATSAVLARLMSPGQLGDYFLALSLATTGAIVGNLGLNQTVQSTVAASLGVGDHERARRLVEVICMLGMFCAVGAGLAYLVLGHLIVTDIFDQPGLGPVNVLIAIWIVCLAAQTLFAETLRALRDILMASMMAGALSAVLVCLSAVVLLAVRGASGLTTVVAVSVSCAGAVSVLAGLVVADRTRRLGPRATTTHIRLGKVLAATWPQLVTMLAASRMTIIPLWVVSASGSQDQAALFGTASRVAFTAVLPFGLATTVVPPIVAELWAREERGRIENLVRTVAGVVFIPVTVVSAVLALFGADILSAAFGNFYADGAPVLAMLVGGYWVSALAGSCGEVLMMTGHQRSMMLITVASVGVLTGACLLVVDEYGVRGVAAATGATFALQNLLMTLAARRACGIWTHADVAAALHRVRSLPALLRR